MDSPANPPKIGILILDQDAPSAASVRQVLESENWRIQVVPEANLLLSELRSGEWSLVVANIAVTGINSAAFLTLQELAAVPVEDGGRMRVLYIVPEETGGNYFKTLEQLRLPYVVRPFHFHDLLEKVSDLLFEVKAIAEPLRQISREFGAVRKKKSVATRDNSMFSTREGYSYTEEEVAEYERQENDPSKRHKPRTNLGDPNR
jgi:DNA-binding response OmpR family regulator